MTLAHFSCLTAPRLMRPSNHNVGVIVKTLGSRKYFMGLAAWVDEGVAVISFYKGSAHFESQAQRDQETVRIFRCVAGFEFGVDYQEYFDGMSWRGCRAHL